jgi:hypothetical protein
MARNYAALPYDYLEEMDALNDAEFGRLTRALLVYSMTGEQIALCGNERFFVKRMMAQEDRFKASYDDIATTRSEAGKAGAAARWQNGKRIFANGKNSKAMPANGKNGNTETNTDTNTETNIQLSNDSKGEYCAEPQAADAPPVISLPLNDGTFFDVSENDRAKWSQLYPNVDVLQQLRHMAGWCDANPTKRKTHGGVKRFITNWLAEEQNKGGKAPQNRPFVGGDVFAEMLEEEKNRGKS